MAIHYIVKFSTIELFLTLEHYSLVINTKIGSIHNGMLNWSAKCSNCANTIAYLVVEVLTLISVMIAYPRRDSNPHGVWPQHFKCCMSPYFITWVFKKRAPFCPLNYYLSIRCNRTTSLWISVQHSTN